MMQKFQGEFIPIFNCQSKGIDLFKCLCGSVELIFNFFADYTIIAFIKVSSVIVFYSDPSKNII